MPPQRPRSTRILLDLVDHLHEIRSGEMAALLRRFHGFFAPPILEIGAGDGFQYHVLRERFGEVVATDLDTTRFPRGEPIVSASASALPFRDGAFRTVFSSNVLEHVPRIELALREMRRVLAPGGHMIHIVPTRLWQALALVSRFPYMLARQAYRTIGRRLCSHPDESWNAWWYAAYDIRWENLWDVPVHGVSRSHCEEWAAFGQARWRQIFRAAGLGIARTGALYAYSPYGFLGGQERWRLTLPELGLASSRAFVLTR